MKGLIRRSFIGIALTAAAAGITGCASAEPAETSASVLTAGNCPPTYYCYGTRDPFYDQFEGRVQLMRDIGYTVHARVLDGWPHGFGAGGGWVPEFDQFMQDAFSAR